MFKKNHGAATQERMLAALAVLRAWPNGVTIGYLRGKVSCSRDELSTALKNLRDEGMAWNPVRGHWRMLPTPSPVVEAPASVGVADSYADIHARAIAEERAQGLAEQLAEERQQAAQDLAEERKRREQAERGLREAGKEFAQVRMLRNHLAKKARRMRKRLAELESIGLSLSMIKDPTIPF